MNIEHSFRLESRSQPTVKLAKEPWLIVANQPTVKLAKEPWFIVANWNAKKTTIDARMDR